MSDSTQSRWRRPFDVDDVAQQLVGSLLIGSPFVVTEEVWALAAGMGPPRLAATVGLILVVAYSVLFVAAVRDPDREARLAVFPVRFLSIVAVSYLGTTLFAVAVGAPAEFTPRSAPPARLAVTLRAATVVGPFSVIGAGTADSLLGLPEADPAAGDAGSGADSDSRNADATGAGTADAAGGEATGTRAAPPDDADGGGPESDRDRGVGTGSAGRGGD